MRPVDQTITGGGDAFGEPHGNCFQACIASLLELPHFCDGRDDWYGAFTSWCIERGFEPMLFKTSKDGWLPAGLHILSGQSPRKPDHPNALHAVVARGREIIHDPNPTRMGLLSFVDTIVLVPLDPARAAS